ncbi:hypothetical protein A3B18_03015 [Candidatus Giovannonibacteria bacterium RIFCSPLOWO2_01_FULL_46_13]|uniref:Transglycosylase SLT domain-containing protein n=1 Tax=Candidatus Giovannonibacteria bacterium RIFCSPLOWO2_01_FULL_46_13 TaxID=1798352 RepID=A0A1F5X321_9BACT|nr:MAG: hypothetical protein A3B18_03015 [Candidatus Giovannonibacteria bacterium RIFCSPLOWO2_01_FULL_46_13]
MKAIIFVLALIFLAPAIASSQQFLEETKIIEEVMISEGVEDELSYRGLDKLFPEEEEIDPWRAKERGEEWVQEEFNILLGSDKALAGAMRCFQPKYQELFHQASEESGFPKEKIEAIAFRESFCNPKAKSPTGPRGIMQFAKATARDEGLKIIQAVRIIKIIKKIKQGKKTKKVVAKKKKPGKIIHDDRLKPHLAIPAAGQHLAWLRRFFNGSMEFAVAAYHSGAGAMGEMIHLAKQKMDGREPTLEDLFFRNSRDHNPKLYEAVLKNMKRDKSPKYPFRIEASERFLKTVREGLGVENVPINAVVASAE